MKAIDAIKSGSKLLRKSKVLSHILDTEILLAKSCKKSREEILIDLNRGIQHEKAAKFHHIVTTVAKNRYQPMLWQMDYTKSERTKILPSN